MTSSRRFVFRLVLAATIAAELWFLAHLLEIRAERRRGAAASVSSATDESGGPSRDGEVVAAAAGGDEEASSGPGAPRILGPADPEPRFDDYPADAAPPAAAAPLDPASDPNAEEFRDRLTAAVEEGPSFAGAYAVATWGCGTNCTVTALVDLRDGKVSFAPFIAALGVRYRRDSRLFVENPPEEYPEVGAGSWTEEDVRRLRRDYGGTTWWVLEGGRLRALARRP